MATPSLATLLEQSKRLNQSQSTLQTQLSDLPNIQLGFEQLASQSRRVGGKPTVNSAGIANSSANA